MVRRELDSYPQASWVNRFAIMAALFTKMSKACPEATKPRRQQKEDPSDQASQQSRPGWLSGRSLPSRDLAQERRLLRLRKEGFECDVPHGLEHTLYRR